ncbi:ACBP-domain-containing protein [Pisolithus croceorrhizus]|nr:ACBP-domain-containing protein [Pisolithus croceorrhizus]KAI6128498.1 ACBP-domain-containing protein [Pisolithus croceorrhizus]
MDPHQLLDAQFNRAVEIVQGLSKTGPIQTGYEEKLNMYSLYKQATIGNVTSSRPGLLDMLGRAKWDAWTKLKDMNQYEAKWRYVDALLKALNKHSDNSTAQDLVNDLQSYGPAYNTALGRMSNTVLPPRGLTSLRTDSSNRSPSRGSDSSGSTASAESPPAFVSRLPGIPGGLPQTDDDAEGSSDGDELGNGTQDLPSLRELPGRPLSSISSRYRTPLTSTLTTSPPPRRSSVPVMQPLPLFETRSASGGSHSASMTSATLPRSGKLPPPSSRDLSPQIHPVPVHYKDQLPSLHNMDSQLQPPSHTETSLEAAVENVQAHVAALTERLDSIEASIVRPLRTSSSMLPSLSRSGSGSPARQQVESLEWDVEDMGLWAYVLRPTLRGVQILQRLLNFFLHSENQSPVLVIFRRLCLDISFTLTVLGLLKLAWRKSRARRREISVALGILWAALLGSNRHLIQHAA